MTTALLTDHYELTMLGAALKDGSSERRCVFEVFARRLPTGRRYGVVAGTERLLAAIENFRFTRPVLNFLRDRGVIDYDTYGFLKNYRFSGDIDGYVEGELYFPGSPILTVQGTFAEAVVLETVILSILNHDCAIAAAAARMVTAAGDRTTIEMGSRRAHEEAAVAASRAAYLAGFDATSNLEAGYLYGIPTKGTSAHAFTLLHDSEAEAFTTQVAAQGVGTTLLVDTYDITAGINTAIEVAGTELGAVRIDSGDLVVLARQAREQLDSLGATGTKIVVSSDLDEHAIAALAVAPVDVYGVGTSVVTGSGHSTAGLVYKLVQVDGRPVVKRSDSKRSNGGLKSAFRRHKPSGTAVEEVLFVGTGRDTQLHSRYLQSHLVSNGQRTSEPRSLDESRKHMQEVLVSLPWEGLKLSHGDPAIPVVIQEVK